MGAVGSNKKSTGTDAGVQEKKKAVNPEFSNYPTNDKNDVKGVTDFDDDSYSGTDKWFANSKMSNYSKWAASLTPAESAGFNHYTGSGYGGLNKSLYEVPWSEMSPSQRKTASAVYEALNRFELNKAIHVARGTDINYIFGSDLSYKFKTGDKKSAMALMKNALSETDGVMQFNGFQSTAAGYRPPWGEMVIHYTIPPSKGAGAYVRPISNHASEREFLLNSNAVVKFDTDSLRFENGKLHVDATWLGQAKDQAFSKKKKK